MDGELQIVNVTNGAAPETKAAPKLASNSNIVIVKKRSSHHVEIDMDQLTWDDGKQLRKLRAQVDGGTLTEDDLITLGEGMIKKVTGWETIGDKPLDLVNKIMESLFEDDDDAKAAEGN